MTQHGERLSLELVDKLYKLANNALDNAKDYGRLNPNVQDQQVGEYLYNKYQRLLNESADLMVQKADKPIKDAIFLWRCKWENIEKGCSNIFDLSLKNFGTYTKLPGSQVVKLKQGYKHVLDALIQKQREKFESRLQLHTQLIKILVCQKSRKRPCQHCLYSQNQEKIVCILTNESNKSDFLIICDHVLCTMSLGSMKENIRKVFDPIELIPDSKLTAIDRLGFETFHKIFLIYKEPFWDENFEGLHLVQVPSDAETVFSMIKDIAWLDCVCSIMPVYKQKRTLCVYVCDNKQVESFDDEFVKAECTELIRKFMKRDDIPEPIDIKRFFLFNL
jgi:hypothetical protein